MNAYDKPVCSTRETCSSEPWEPVAAAPVAEGLPADGMFIRLRFMRRLALALAVVGLLLLHRAARQRELPWVTAEDLTPTMQFASVRAGGIMSDAPSLYSRDGEINVISFAIHEGGQSLNVVAFGQTARDIAEEGCRPQPGDRLEVTGVVQISPRYGPQIHVRQAAHVSIVPSSTGTPP